MLRVIACIEEPPLIAKILGYVRRRDGRSLGDAGKENIKSFIQPGALIASLASA